MGVRALQVDTPSPAAAASLLTAGRVCCFSSVINRLPNKDLAFAPAAPRETPLLDPMSRFRHGWGRVLHRKQDSQML